MANVKAKKHEPLFHIIKRPAMSKLGCMLIRIAAVLAAAACCSLIVFIAGHANPAQYFGALFRGAFGTRDLTWSYLYSAAILLLIAVAVTPAFKMRFWNIGAEGQVLVGGLAATACMFYFGNKIPLLALYALMIVTSVIAGIIWALIPALFKAKWNTNETLFTLMMNYIAIQLVAFFIDVWVKDGSGTLKPMDQYGFPTVINKWALNIFVILAITIVMFVYLNYSKHGYEISVVGESENTARYIGINVRSVVVRTLVLSGALCGIAGLIITAGFDHTIKTNSAGGDGFTAILVSWLAKFNPLIMILTAMLIVFFDVGALQVRTELGLDNISEITTAIILFFIIGCEFFINYKIVFRKSHKEVA